MWTKLTVTMNFVTKLVSSVPADPEIRRRWLESRLAKKSRPPNSRSIDEIAEELTETTPAEDEDQESGMTVFQRKDGILVVRASTTRAHIKDCANILSVHFVGKIEKQRSFAHMVKNCIYYPPEVYWLPILNQDTDEPFIEPSGSFDKPVHAQTPRGPISAIKRFEYVDNARLKVPLLILTPKNGRPQISEQDLSSLFMYGGTHGYAGERSDGEGRYMATIEVTERPPKLDSDKKD